MIVSKTRNAPGWATKEDNLIPIGVKCNENVIWVSVLRLCCWHCIDCKAARIRPNRKGSTPVLKPNKLYIKHLNSLYRIKLINFHTHGSFKKAFDITLIILSVILCNFCAYFFSIFPYQEEFDSVYNSTTSQVI